MHLAIASWIHSYFDIMINNGTDTRKTDANFLIAPTLILLPVVLLDYLACNYFTSE